VRSIIALLLAGMGQVIVAVGALDHPGRGQLAQPLGEQPPRDARHAAVDVVEAAAAEHELA